MHENAGNAKLLLGNYTRGWVKYNIYILTNEAWQKKPLKNKKQIILSIRIINAEDNISPLRRQGRSLEQYNVLYEYLLNQAKNDLVLISGNSIAYPVYYSFENNYNAVPFETINVGYDISSMAHKSKKRGVSMRLLYMDKIFSHDTLSCSLL